MEAFSLYLFFMANLTWHVEFHVTGIRLAGRAKVENHDDILADLVFLRSH